MISTRIASARQVFLGRQFVSLDERVKLENSFFKSISLPNGTHKTTAPERLSDVDAMISEHMEDRDTVRLLDVGISSGVTTLELLSHLEGQGIRVSGVGVDICVRGFLWSFMGIDVLRDPEGNVLQVATPLFARGRPDRSQKSLRSKVLALGMNLLESRLIRKWMGNSRRSHSVDLVSRRLLEWNDFTVVEHDMALPMPAWNESFDLIRAANVLNLDYFAPSQISTMLSNLTSWLKPGGLLVVCSTRAPDGSNHGSLYRKQYGTQQLRAVRRIGHGFELDHCIEASPGNDPEARKSN